MSNARRIALAASAASFLGIVPHSIEDFIEGVPARFGLSTSAAAWLLGIALTVQIGLLILAAARHYRPALAGIAIYGIGWVVAALADHPQAVLPVAFRNGPSSRAWVLLIVVGQAVAAVAAAVALRRRPRPNGPEHATTDRQTPDGP
jgi:hypothetical protein